MKRNARRRIDKCQRVKTRPSELLLPDTDWNYADSCKLTVSNTAIFNPADL